MVPQRLITQMKNMFENSTDAVYIKDTDFRYYYINSACLNRLELNRDEVLLKSDAESHLSEYASIYNTHDWAAMHGKIYYQLDEASTTRGEKLFSLSQKLPLTDEYGKIYGSLGLTQHLKHEELRFALSSKNYFKKHYINIAVDKKTLLNPQVDLSIREMDVLYHFLQGKSARTIAEELGISERTIVFHLNNIKKIWRCHSKEELFKTAFEKGFIRFPGLWAILASNRQHTRAL